MPALFWTPTRALGHTFVRRCFQPCPILGKLRAAPPFAAHRPASLPRPRFMSQYLANIHEDLQLSKEDKWGWVIYRTTYKDDAGWERFKGYVNAWNQELLSGPEEHDVPSAVLSAMEWTFVSDPATLDGASRQQLRHRFRDWRNTAIQAENPRRDPADTNLSQRYLFFVRVDEDSLKSVLEGNGDFLDLSWVHLIRCDEELDFGRPLEHKDGELDWSLSPIPEHEDDGWMMISVHMINGEFYASLGTAIEYWYAFYASPPSVVHY